MMTNHFSKGSSNIEGILLVNKPKGATSFRLVAQLRRHLGVKKIGHAGTLDPFATGVMVMLIGRKYTQLSDKFLNSDKEYIAELLLGIATDTQDCEGQVIKESSYSPTQEEIESALATFQGDIEQVPPMFSAKKVQGKKLYELARSGKTIERQPVKVHVDAHLLKNEYPRMDIHVTCSKGTYIRTLAHDMGEKLGCGAHLTNLQRTRSGSFRLENCIDGTLLESPDLDINILLDNLITTAFD